MSTTINQEVLEIGATGTGNTRINQEVLMIGTPSSGSMRLNQLVSMMLVPSSLVGTKVQITGGPFQDALGNVLSNGYLSFQLQHDAVVLYTAQIVGRTAVRVPLDTNGYIRGTTTGTPVYIWPNNVLYPADGTYLIWAYDANNRQVWENPQVQQVNSTPNPFNVNIWIPGP